MMRYVIAYDVSDDTKRTRVADSLKAYGRRVEKSMFECNLARTELETVLVQLRELMTPSTDRCHVYRLCAECAAQRVIIGDDIELDWGQTVIV